LSILVLSIFQNQRTTGARSLKNIQIKELLIPVVSETLKDLIVFMNKLAINSLAGSLTF
jgi:hypothetical protein